MSIRIVCPNCRTVYQATDDQRGRRVRCKECQAIFCAAGPEESQKPDRESSVINRPRRRRVFPRIPPFALFLIIGGVGGSLLIVAGSVVFCIWLWQNPPGTWRISQRAEKARLFPMGPRFPMQAPNFHADQAANGDGKEIVGQEPEADQPVPPPPHELDFASETPLVQKSAHLVLRHQVGSRPLVLESWLDIKVTGPDGVEHTGSASAQTRLTETTEAVDAQELASVRLLYRACNVTLRRDNQNLPNPAAIIRARQNIKRLAANLRIDRQGNLVRNEVDLNRVPRALRPFLADVHEELTRALGSLTAPLPNREVAPGESWKSKRTLLIPTPRQSVVAHLDMSYRYLGTREYAGRQEAVLDLQGAIKGLEDPVVKGTGHAHGLAAVDLAGGQVTEAQMVVVFNMDMNPRARSLSSSGKLMLRLRRGLPAGDVGS